MRRTKDAPFDTTCNIGNCVTTGIGAVMNTAKVETGSREFIIGVAPAEISTRTYQLATGPFGGASGRTYVQKIVDWFVDGKGEIEIEDVSLMSAIRATATEF